MDLRGASRPCHEEKNLKNLSPSWKTEDCGHPRSDPFEMLWRLDDPDKNDFSGRDCACCEAGHEIADVRNLVGDADTRGKKQNSAVRVMRLMTYITLVSYRLFESR